MSFFRSPGAPLFRKPDLSLVHWRTSYTNEAKALTRYMMRKHGVKDFAFLYQNDSYGIGALQGARDLLRDKKDVHSKEIPYERNSASF